MKSGTYGKNVKLFREFEFEIRLIKNGIKTLCKKKIFMRKTILTELFKVTQQNVKYKKRMLMIRRTLTKWRETSDATKTF